MKTVLIVETGNTGNGATQDRILSKFAVCRNDADKRKALPGFTQPTCTDNPELLAEAIRLEALVDCWPYATEHKP